MHTWDDVRAQLAAGKAEVVASMITRLDDAGRTAIAKELPGYLKSRSSGNWSLWGHHRREAQALRIAGAGCIPGAAGAAAWLCRADLDIRDNGAVHALLIARVVAARPASWRADVARRISRRLRVTDQASRWGGQDRWRLADMLARSGGEGLPDDDAYVVGWAQWTDPYPWLNEEPYLDELLPRIFEVEAVGRVLGLRAHDDDPWIDMLTRLAAVGRVEREMLLDGCVRRLLRGGRIQDLRWYLDLYRALEPSPAEARTHIRDLARLLPAAPGPVAEFALDELRRVDEAADLDEATFAEVAEALLFRPEKKLVRAALSWIDRTARERDRVEASLTALTVAFGQDKLDLQERAARVAAKHAAKASEPVRDAVRQAAAGLPKEARDRVAEAFGAVTVTAATAPVTGLTPPPPPRELPPLARSVAELTEEVAAYLHGELTWRDGERVLAGLVEFAHREPGETRAAVRRVVPDLAPWLLFVDDDYSDHPTRWLGAALRPLVAPAEPRRKPVPDLDRKGPAPSAALCGRMREVAGAVGRLPVLLATPTHTTGHVAPEVLVERLERLEAAGLRPGPLDLEQALLRLPRDIPGDVVLRARRLGSPEGRRAAAWLADGGLPDPRVTCEAVSIPRTVYSWRGSESQAVDRVLPTIVAAETGGAEPEPHGLADLLLGLPRQGWKRLASQAHVPYCFSWWPSLLPSHREVLAAHLLVPFADEVESRHGQGGILLSLAEADGPVGPATATALALGLGSKRAEERSASVDALLTFCARGQLPPVGDAIAVLAGSAGELKLNRVTGALTDAARAGAHADVLRVIAAALPELLPRPGERPMTGLPDLIALATEAAETGARCPVPAGLAGRTGTGRLAREAGRLHRILTGAPA
ncbi:DUF6493 family protein [Actinomadura fulvescens]|uniref:DUF6493 family protein n=1 Tax=Actinomadura fulvescens TaxID=46160 RepID=A0ABN3PKP6_9ACTN